MRGALVYLKNKYLLATFIFLIYALLLDDHDIFTISRNQTKLIEIITIKQKVATELYKTQSTLFKLDKPEEVQRFAREHKFFKKDDEDIFVIFYE